MKKTGLLMCAAGFLMVFIMVFTGCDDGGGGGGGGASASQYVEIEDSYWDGKVNVTIGGIKASSDVYIYISASGDKWNFYALADSDYNDSGTYTRNGNNATLYSNGNNRNIGTAKITGNNKMSVSLTYPAELKGTYTLTRR